MNISSPFIERPVATTLLTIGVALAGAARVPAAAGVAAAAGRLPDDLGQATLPGASPETMAATVATPLERSLGRIAGVTEMTSTSALGSTRDRRCSSTSTATSTARRATCRPRSTRRAAQLPTGLPSNPTYRKVNPADAPIMILALTSDTLTQGQMYDAASTILAQKLSQVEGVGQVRVGGSSLPAVRVELNPHGAEQVRHRLRGRARGARRRQRQPARRARSRTATAHWQIDANDQAKTAASTCR